MPPNLSTPARIIMSKNFGTIEKQSNHGENLVLLEVFFIIEILCRQEPVQGTGLTTKQSDPILKIPFRRGRGYG
jgi:hypothetical protein